MQAWFPATGPEGPVCSVLWFPARQDQTGQRPSHLTKIGHLPPPCSDWKQFSRTNDPLPGTYTGYQ
ncbi:hypothetical protein DEDE109153_00660 [Deinococcus deserti]